MLATERCEPADGEEQEALIWQCVEAKNRYANRSGFTPQQRVFGRTTRLPRSMLSDDIIDPDILAIAGKCDFAKANEMRAAAMKAYLEDETIMACERLHLHDRGC